MTAAHGSIPGRILLVSAPWPLFNRPSLPLGALKGYLQKEWPSLAVEASHLYLQIAHRLGFDRYHRISQRVWRAEAVYAALLYSEQAHQAERLYAGTIKKGGDAPTDFSRLVGEVETATDEWFDRVDWPDLDLVGFSVSFCQVTASLYLISKIKTAYPALPVVVGGSSFSGQRSADILRIFPQIDYLIAGEGELALTRLVGRLLDPSRPEARRELPADLIFTAASETCQRPFLQLRRLDTLPAPDYDDYFSMLAGFAPRDRFFPTLPIESSRGCWWRRKDSSGRFGGCAFCNLNLQWQGYRTKTADQVVHEVDHLVRKHQVLSLAFADNALPEKQVGAIFDGIRRQDRNLSIFAEIRATTPLSLIQKMRQAGVDTVQVGIEALSSRLLGKMNKGVRAIDNLCLMKHCEAAGIINASNLILHFPSSDADDIVQTLHCLAFARWYRPLKTVSFWLGLDSPAFRFPEQFQIHSTFNHPRLKKLFPAPIARQLRFMIQGYRGDRRRQLQLWRRVEKAVDRWRRDYALVQRQTNGRPALSYRDGGHFLIIDQHRPKEPVAKHRLVGTSAQIYRFCHVPRTLEQISGRFASHSTAQIRSFLESMEDKQLAFAEDGSYLSLAVPHAERSRR